ncbi:large ribosomal subunit protein uL2m-like [Apostichopus japonicus]|uniref:large ribosomal subunit protein uL2m-like n=1 Tax=Stichopus japonicus TaxID=307972 RepID=UPI003AB64ECA
MALQGVRLLFQKLTITRSVPKLVENARGLSVLSSTVQKYGIYNGRLPIVCSASKQKTISSRYQEVHSSAVFQMPGVVKPWQLTKYTIRPIPMRRDGGRDPLTGRITYKRRGGGHKRNFRMIDWHRIGPADGPPYEEKVLAILYDPNRSARIALVAGGNKKRYILATMNMQEGDIIKTSAKIGRMTVIANEGDAYPVGAYPIGALVHNLERIPAEGSRLAHAAGTCAQILRKAGGQVILQLPSKRQISVSEKCMATFGRLSNEEHNKRILGKAGRSRWLGIRPKSGLYQKKGGWAGRKIKPLPPMKIYLDPKAKGTRIDDV